MRPTPWQPRPIPTLWLDYTTGAGVDDAGHLIKPLIGGRRTKPQLVDLLETARHHQAERIMLTGAVPLSEPGRRHWLAVRTEGWSSRGHWFSEPATGRFRHDKTRVDVQVRLAREWFGDTDLSPATGREAWTVTATALDRATKGARMFASPAGTGQNVWALSLPAAYTGDQVDDDIADLIHATSGQHRQEHFVAGRSRCDCGDCPPLVTEAKVDGFAYLDGRFMYSALCRELGTAPATRLTADQATRLAETDLYARARYRVTFTVPTGWDTLGLLAVARPDSDLWHYPNRAGATATTWCDSSELHIAGIAGWALTIHDAIQFTPGRPLDTFIAHILKARNIVAGFDLTPDLRAQVNAALRMVLLQTIGGFHSRGRTRNQVTFSALEIPTQYAHTVTQYADGAFVWKEPVTTNPRTAAFHHPELSAQVWARERSRVLYAPIAAIPGPGGVRVDRAGALDLDPATLIGINGDALYTSYVPTWALPVDQGGGDDGKQGRLRLQGYLPGPLTTPATAEVRNRLRKRAEAAGVATVTKEATRW